MPKISRPKALLASLALLSAAEAAHGQDSAWSHTYAYSSFFSKANFGDLALSYTNITAPAEARQLTILPPERRVAFPRRKVHDCWAFLAHRRLGQDGRAETQPMYAGIQIVSLYGRHKDAGAVFVQRNSRWESRTSKSELPELASTRVTGMSYDKFSNSHSDLATLAKVTTEKGRLLEVWHGKVPVDDSADPAGLSFWHVDPIQLLHDDYTDLVKNKGSKVLVENRLLKFTPTDSNSPRTAPPFNFDCRRPELQAIMFRVFLSRSATAERERIFFVDFVAE